MELTDSLGRFGIGRGGESGRQGGNITDFNNSVLGDETGLVQGNETAIMLSSYSSNNIKFSALKSAVVEGRGLHSLIPSIYPLAQTSLPAELRLNVCCAGGCRCKGCCVHFWCAEFLYFLADGKGGTIM